SWRGMGSGVEGRPDILTVDRTGRLIVAGEDLTHVGEKETYLIGRWNQSISEVRGESALTAGSLQPVVNPASDHVEFQLSLQREESVRLTLTTLDGRFRVVVADKHYAPGTHRIVYEGEALESGLYFYEGEMGGRKESGVVIVLR
ncbi:MAG: hypothetical protein AB7H80_16190, partial [Candidatus Kapaibacterium sp.]